MKKKTDRVGSIKEVDNCGIHFLLPSYVGSGNQTHIMRFA